MLTAEPAYILVRRRNFHLYERWHLECVHLGFSYCEVSQGFSEVIEIINEAAAQHRLKGYAGLE